MLFSPDKSFGLISWFDPTLNLSGWFDDEYATQSSKTEEHYGGGWEYVIHPNRTKKDIEKARKEYGLAFDVIESVALRQSKHLLTDEQKIYDELSRELTLRGLEFESRHLELLNYQREKLIGDEIQKWIKFGLEEDEAILMILAMSI